MHSHAAHHGLNFKPLRDVLHLPRRTRPFTRPAQAAGVAPLGWLERLALWAERQPMHHRMGSYMRRR